MEDRTEQSLRRALESLRIKELPRQYKDGMGFWIRALVKVRKSDNRCYYMAAERNGWGVMRYIKDFGPVMRVMAVVGVYPYMYLDEARYGLRYSGEESMRKRLAGFFRAHYGKLADGAGYDTKAGGALLADGERLAKRAEACPSGELASLDRERMAMLQRQDWNRPLGEYATREVLDAKSNSVIETAAGKIMAAALGGTLSVPAAAAQPIKEESPAPAPAPAPAPGPAPKPAPRKRGRPRKGA